MKHEVAAAYRRMDCIGIPDVTRHMLEIEITNGGEVRSGPAEDADMVAFCRKRGGQVGAKEAGCPGDKNAHGSEGKRESGRK